ncbi:glycosyltransferase family 2 protein [Salinicola aestuarinus]|uniref:glycosyltransferase family 2 protein n=1 Tax=Salinicola aestuarinus TaxID=1949082 RepID=UPI000DA1B228|nr:glycosyltransferase [Salinicola aestuarinus]
MSLRPVPLLSNDSHAVPLRQRLQAALRLVCAPRLRPVHQLEAIDPQSPAGREGFTWRATGEDPQFLWHRRLPLPGWNMLEATLGHDQPNAAVRLYLDTGEGFSEAQSLYLVLLPGRMSKRLCYIPPGTQAIRFDPLETPGNLVIRHLRLVWLMPAFARDRLAQRLCNLHPEWLETPKDEVVSALKAAARDRGQPWRPLALAQYESTFVRRCAGRSYNEWLRAQTPLSAVAIARRMERFTQKPLISIVVPVHDPDPVHLRECLQSVIDQQYPHWQLCIADDASRDPDVWNILSAVAASDSRIELVQRESNGHICAASNTALSLARGEFVALLDHDDCLHAEALFRVVEALQSNPAAEVLYSDEDKIDDRGERFEPHFKPAWNPDLLLSQNYISHLGVYRRERLLSLGGFRPGFEGSQDHDLALRFVNGLESRAIVRVPHVLYHWRASTGSTATAAASKNYTHQAGLSAVREHLERTNLTASVEAGRYPNTYRVRWPLPSPAPRVSLLVPTRDRVEVLRPCLEALLERTDYPNFELLVLDNGSRCAETLAFLETVASDPRVRVLGWPAPFNYSAINNFGAREATGDILALINNDIEPLNPDWLTEMVSQACRPGIGCVGAKLYYPNGTVQHAGVVLGIGGVAGHAHKYFSRHEPGYFSRLHLVQNYSAVTAACLVVQRRIFEAVGGLDEANLAVAFNDVDFCLRVGEAGYRHVWTPYAELWHHESVSRGADDTSKKRLRAAGEANYMRTRWRHRLFDDPAYHPNLTLTYEDFSLR